jgi:hypothetical protein
LSGFPIGFEVDPNGFTGRALGRFDVLSVSGDRQIGRLHRKSRLGLFQHDQESHHLISSLIFFTVSTDRPTGTSFSGCTMVTINRLAGCLQL